MEIFSLIFDLIFLGLFPVQTLSVWYVNFAF